MLKLPTVISLFMLTFLFTWNSGPTAHAARLTVDDDGKDLPTAGFNSIHGALEAANDGDEIVVYPGRYYAPVHFRGKNVYLHGTDPTDPNIVRSTIIDGQILDSTVIFSGEETETCILEGLTITNGFSLSNGGGIRGGVSKACKATIRFNLIENNEANEYGGGISNCAGLIIGNTIRDNSAAWGGGLANCNSPAIQSNSILNNQALEGGGLYGCNGPINKNIIAGNIAYNDGGGLKVCRGLIQENSIRENTASVGAGLISCTGQVIENTISGNIADNDGGALHTCSGTVRGNTILANSARNGAALFNCDGTIEVNRIERNAARQAGGGLYSCDGSILDNTIIANTAKTFGGAIANSLDVIISHNLFEANQASTGAAIANSLAHIESNRFLANQANRGGVLIDCDGTFRNNLFAGNRATTGTVMSRCQGQFFQNTFADNHLTTDFGAAIELMEGCLFRENIFYRNDQLVFSLDTSGGIDPGLIFIQRNDFFDHQLGLIQIDDTSAITTADDLNQQLSGCLENRIADPLFVDPAGPDGQNDTVDDNDYHLDPESPAINRATIQGLNLIPVTDLDGLGRWAGDMPDLGCYEYAHETDSDGDGLADTRELALGSDPELADTDGDGLIDSMEVRRGTHPAEANDGAGLTVPGSYPTVQEAVLMAFNGESVIIQPGVYYESINLGAKSIRLAGTIPSDPDTVESTVIDATRQGPVLILSGDQDKRMVIEGLTLRGGNAPVGSAIFAQNALATLSKCVITDNIAQLGGTVDSLRGNITGNRFENNQALRGGALANCPGTISGNIMRGNTTDDDGGAIYRAEGEIHNNTFENNNASRGDGGAIAVAYGPVYDNIFTGNKALRGGALYQCSDLIYLNLIQANQARDGGGLFQCHDIIRDNRILDNTAQEGGGLYQCHGEITGNTIYGNKASFNGGGLSGCRAEIHHNTISHNEAYTGGGLVQCNAPIHDNWMIENVAANNGGAIAASGTLINGNRLQGNQAFNGGAIAYTDATIRNNMIFDNVAINGGALYRCDGLVDANTLRGNTADQTGGAIASSAGVILNNMILGNIGQRGGAIHGCQGTIGWNTIVGNKTPTGGVCGGLLNCTAVIANNIMAFNSNHAVGIDDADTTPSTYVANCFYNNWDGLLLLPDGSRLYDLSAVESTQPNFTGNLQADPHFLNPLGNDLKYDTYADNDYRLRPDSPCLDRSFAVDFEPTTDFEGTTRPLDGDGDNQAVSDLGALEFFAVSILEPNGEISIHAGSVLNIVWKNDLVWAGQALRFELWQGDRFVLTLGFDWNPAGQGTAHIVLPLDLEPGGDYYLRAISTWNPALRTTSQVIELLPPDTAACPIWMLYE